MTNEHTKNKPTYIMVPRSLIVTWLVSFLSVAILAGASIQWSNFIDRRSNQRWCGIVQLFNDTYKETPPPTEIGKKFAVEFTKLQQDFKCKNT